MRYSPPMDPARTRVASGCHPMPRSPADGPGRGFRGATLLGLVLATLTGCAIDIPRIDLYSDALANPPGATFGLLPLEDQRPESQRVGKKPRLWIFLLYNQRTGTYLTGNQHFEGDVSDAVSRALTDALDGTRFGRARLLDAAPSRSVPRALAACVEEDLRFVGLGSIESLYGTIRQRAYFGILPIPFLTLIGFANSASDPLGVIELDLEILDCGTRRSVYRRRITRQLRFPEETPSHAVRLALTDILQQVQNETARR